MAKAIIILFFYCLASKPSDTAFYEFKKLKGEKELYIFFENDFDRAPSFDDGLLLLQVMSAHSNAIGIHRDFSRNGQKLENSHIMEDTVVAPSCCNDTKGKLDTENSGPDVARFGISDIITIVSTGRYR